MHQTKALDRQQYTYNKCTLYNIGDCELYALNGKTTAYLHTVHLAVHAAAYIKSFESQAKISDRA